MARSFQIIGADRDSGVDLRFTLEAENAAQAATLANDAGVMVAEVREFPPPPPPRRDSPVVLPTPASPAKPWSRREVSLSYFTSAILLLFAVGIVVSCANTLADGLERLEKAQARAKLSHSFRPGTTVYNYVSNSENLPLYEPHDIAPPPTPAKTMADQALADEQSRQSGLRVAQYGVAPALAVAAIALAVVARRKGEPSAG